MSGHEGVRACVRACVHVCVCVCVRVCVSPGARDTCCTTTGEWRVRDLAGRRAGLLLQAKREPCKPFICTNGGRRGINKTAPASCPEDAASSSTSALTGAGRDRKVHPTAAFSTRLQVAAHHEVISLPNEASEPAMRTATRWWQALLLCRAVDFLHNVSFFLLPLPGIRLVSRP